MMWFVFAFLTASFETLKDIVSKRTVADVSEYMVAWSWIFFALPFLLLVVVVQGIPPLGEGFWPVLALAGSINSISFTLYVKAIKHSDLSVTVPMIAFTPMFMLVTSPLILGERPGLLGSIGIVLIVVGSYVLNLKERNRGLLGPYRALLRERGPKIMLLVAFIWSVAGNLDKVGVNNSGPVFWILSVHSVTAGILTLVMLWHTRDYRDIVRNIRPFTMIGFCSAMAAISQMTAITMTLVPYVISVKRTSIVMSVLSGHIIFKEKGLVERLSGVAIMIAGILCITLLQ